MQLTKEQLQDKIIELEMELKELSWREDIDICWEMVDEASRDFLYNSAEGMEKLREEKYSWIQYYQAELQYIEDLKYE
jgi:hypothetical protein